MGNTLTFPKLSHSFACILYMILLEAIEIVDLVTKYLLDLKGDSFLGGLCQCS